MFDIFPANKSEFGLPTLLREKFSSWVARHLEWDPSHLLVIGQNPSFQTKHVLESLRKSFTFFRTGTSYGPVQE